MTPASRLLRFAIATAIAAAPAGGAEATLDSATRRALAERARRETAAAIAELATSTHASQEKAGERLASAVALWRQIDEPRELGRALVALGRAAESSGENERALAAHREARDLAIAAKDPPLEAEAELGLGHLEWLLGRPEEALAHGHRALDLFATEGDRDGQRSARFKIGLALQSLGRRAEATEQFEALVAELRGDPASFEPRQSAHLLYSLGTVRRDAGDLPAARAAFAEAATRAEAARHLAHQARSLAALGETEAALGDRRAGRVTLERALRLWRQHGDPEGTGLALAALSRFEADDGELAAATRHLEQTLAVLDRMRGSVVDPTLRATFFGARHHFFARHVELLAARHERDPGGGFDALAFRASERARARVLLDLLNAARGEVATAGEERLVPIGQLQQRDLDDRTLLMSYFLGSDRVYLFLVSRRSFRLVTLATSRAEVESRAREGAERLAHSHERLARGGAEAVARELGELLLGGVAELADYPRLLVVPDGELTRLPFAALIAPGEALSEPLIAHHELVLLPSASTLAAISAAPSRAPRGTSRLAVFADPVFGPDDERLPPPRAPAREAPEESAEDDPVLSRLPGTRREAQAILRIAAHQHPLAALGFDARRELALSPQVAEAELLHFATHAVVDEEHPERTALILSRRDASGRRIDGRLRLADLTRARLRADLVVLSGCSTRGGHLLAGEGLLGLVRSFLDAGAARVVASLWPVRDDATATFFERFYVALLRDRLSPTAALRAAQLAMRDDPRTGPPHFWAGFVLEGLPR